MRTSHRRQVVPLINPHTTLVDTDMEYRAAHDSGDALAVEAVGVVKYVSADQIRARHEDSALDRYELEKYYRSNVSKNYNQAPNARKGEGIVKGKVIASGSSMAKGELTLGRSPPIAFIAWNTCNYEGTITVSERMAKDDIYTSIHIEDYKSETHDTELGPEGITRGIPNVGEDALEDLDE